MDTDSRLETCTLDANGVDVFLHRFANEGRTPVLLLHGASAGHQTFTIPGRSASGENRSLMEVLHAAGYEPWLLDWRGSFNVALNCGEERLKKPDCRKLFTFDEAAEQDLPAALEKIEEVREGVESIGVIGFCMGGGILAQSIATGVLEEFPEVRHIVLMTLGLFYATPFDGTLKSQDRILERLRSLPDSPGWINPRADKQDWPEELENVYENWKVLWADDEGSGSNVAEDMYRRICFMYGAPYIRGRLDDRVFHGKDGSDEKEPELLRQFGPIPYFLYMHGARNVRRGWAGPFHGEYHDSVDYIREKPYLGALPRRRFGGLERITLITGSRNRLWHRDSIDRMYEWLNRGFGRASGRVCKEIIQGYGHQDLLWGKNACEDVFPKILSGLPPVLPPVR